MVNDYFIQVGGTRLRASEILAFDYKENLIDWGGKTIVTFKGGGTVKIDGHWVREISRELQGLGCMGNLNE